MSSTVATLVIAPKHVAAYAVSMFRRTKEIDSIVSATARDLSSPKKLIDPRKLTQARMVYRNSTVNVGYLFRYLMDKCPDIYGQLEKIPDSHRMICRVEVPKAENKKYRNIDVGLTSNGKREHGESIKGCSIRETYEESRLLIPSDQYSPRLQSTRRKELGLSNLPLSFSNGKVHCYILIL